MDKDIIFSELVVYGHGGVEWGSYRDGLPGGKLLRGMQAPLPGVLPQPFLELLFPLPAV